jgi:hypothetical protein
MTVYPALGLAGGACQGHGFLLDIRDPGNRTRVAAVQDENFAHSLGHVQQRRHEDPVQDECGGGLAPKCRATDRPDSSSA